MSSSLASNRVLSTCLILNFIKPEFVGDKVKKVNLKAGVKRKQSTPNFRKTSISSPLIHISLCVYQGVRNIRFSENLACFVFVLNFAFSSTNYSNQRPLILPTPSLFYSLKRVLMTISWKHRQSIYAI